MLVTWAWICISAATASALFNEDFEQFFFEEEPGLYAKDHTLVAGPDSLYHLFYIVGHAGESWSDPGNEIDFGHATSADLVHWQVHPRVLGIDPPHRWKSRNVWAPHVVRWLQALSPVYLMTYAGVDSAINQQIGVAVSADLYDWHDLSIESAAYRPDTVWADWDQQGSWSNCRDPFVLVPGGELHLLTTAKTRDGYLGYGSRGAVSLAHCSDGLSWLDAGAPLVVNDNWSLMESAHLVENPLTAAWHLYYTRTSTPGGVHVLSSSQPLAGWDIATGALFDLSGIASETTADGEVYSSVVPYRAPDGGTSRGVRFDDLDWSGGEPAIVRRERFWDSWSLIEGNLGPLPTMHDRPAMRTGVPSNIEGTFWIGTAEQYAGPYGGGCWNCTPNETLVGRLRSRAFTIAGDRMELWVGGTASPLTRVTLVDSSSAAVHRFAIGPGGDVMVRHQWDLTPLLGLRVYLEIIDQHPAGHLNVDAIRELGAPIGVEPDASGPEARLTPPLLTPAANPCRPPASLWLGLQRASPVELRVHDVGGRLVRRLDLGRLAAGRHRIVWDGRTSSGHRAAGGVYYLRVSGPPAAVPTPGTRLVLVR
jgi:hypothetical protein